MQSDRNRPSVKQKPRISPYAQAEISMLGEKVRQQEEAEEYERAMEQRKQDELNEYRATQLEQRAAAAESRALADAELAKKRNFDRMMEEALAPIKKEREQIKLDLDRQRRDWLNETNPIEKQRKQTNLELAQAQLAYHEAVDPVDKQIKYQQLKEAEQRARQALAKTAYDMETLPIRIAGEKASVQSKVTKADWDVMTFPERVEYTKLQTAKLRDAVPEREKYNDLLARQTQQQENFERMQGLREKGVLDDNAYRKWQMSFQEEGRAWDKEKFQLEQDAKEAAVSLKRMQEEAKLGNEQGKAQSKLVDSAIRQLAQSHAIDQLKKRGVDFYSKEHYDQVVTDLSNQLRRDLENGDNLVALSLAKPISLGLSNMILSRYDVVNDNAYQQIIDKGKLATVPIQEAIQKMVKAGILKPKGGK